VADTIDFDPNLYRGTAQDYERFRAPYPQAMIDEVLDRAQASGEGRLMDLACGTGQIAFAVASRFAEVWAVDQEPDMIEAVRGKAQAAGTTHLRTIISTAESLHAPSEAFELVAIGNAFHRLRRETIAAKALRWLKRNRCIALLWANSPWAGQADWQRAMSAVIASWRTKLGVEDRVPAGWDQARRERPDVTVLRTAGFQPDHAARHPTDHEWTIDALTGFIYSTSALPRAIIGNHATEFERDLRRELGDITNDNTLHETIDFAYELARRPA